MADWDPEAFETALVADMRANDGAVTSGPLAGHPLLIMTATGAKSGQPRRSILTWSRDGDAYVVAGTAGGAPTTPSWVANVRSNPGVTIEVGNRTVEATATIAEGADRDRLWAQHVAALPHFADYPRQTGRVIPMIRLTPARD
jgi:deazaflavin-dependent oxidoreductase (nitroreductase family)